MPASSLRNRVIHMAVSCGMVLAGAGISAAHADMTYTSAAKVVHVIDFSDFVGERLETNGPVNLSIGVVWSAWHDGWVGDMSFGLRGNGYWDEGRAGFAGLNAFDSAMIVTFDDPVAQVGALVNYAPLNGQGTIPTIEAMDAYGQVIDSISVDISTPNGVNEGQFLGFEHETADIFAFRYRARYGVLDDLTWTYDATGFIPTPSSLMSLGMLALGLGYRRRPS